jgi:hypothetical protein
MWSITSYYNPVRYKRRLANYRAFRENLAVPLVTVELSFDGRFELTEGDADILIQISGGAVLWQKERLLNVALKSVPSNVSNIAWLDCDVIFERSDWVDAANEQLNKFNVIQLFSDIVDLNRDDHPDNCHDTPPSAHGIVGLISENRFGQSEVMPSARQNKRGFAQGGLAWAVRRQILEQHGLYDAMIAGGGARAQVRALYANFDKHMDAAHFNAAQREHYLKWAVPYHRSVGERVGHVAGRLYHLWHGDIDNRNYDGRHRGLAEHNFNPNTDIAIGSNGAWRWARSRPDLEKFLRNFFIGRAEDG